MSEANGQGALGKDGGRLMRAQEGHGNFGPVEETMPRRQQRMVDAHVIAEVLHGCPQVDPERLKDDLDAVVDQGLEPRV